MVSSALLEAVMREIEFLIPDVAEMDRPLVALPTISLTALGLIAHQW
jgi:hypothetical protein